MDALVLLGLLFAFLLLLLFALFFFFVGGCFIYNELEGREKGSAGNTPDTKACRLVPSTGLL